MRVARILSGGLLLVAIASCSSDPVLVTPRSFDHPGAVAIVCIDTVGQEAVPLSRCSGSEVSNDLSLHALVTQTNRGEVAAVDLRKNLIIDSDVRVPGYTFVPVGELPSAIVVPALNPAWTFIADLGSLDVLAVPTKRFRYRPPSGAVDQQVVSMPVAPTDLALSPDESSLFVALPDAGAIGRIPIDASGIAGPLEQLALAIDVPPGLDAEWRPPYCRACLGPGQEGCGTLLDPFPTDEMGTPLPLPPREPAFGGDESLSRPVAIEVDPEQGVLLIADANLPIVHVLDIADPSVVHPPLAVGVPTTGLALTPAVPDQVGDSSTVTRYLYAIDAIDGSVLAIEYGVGVDGPTGAVLPVDVRPGRASDRINLGASARVLEVITPDYPAGAPCQPEDVEAGEAAPERLRGVFLAVGTANGLLHVIDVYDLDASCRGGDTMCAGASDDDSEVYIRRHRPRIGSRILDGIAAVGTPATSFNDLSFAVEADGTTEGELAPNLDTLEACAPGMIEIFPLDEVEGPLICTLADPWAARPEQWLATWEGRIPGTGGGRGQFATGIAGEPIFVGEVPFCRRGVLGSADVGTEPPDVGYAGDQLVITGEISPSVEGPAREMCESMLLDATGDLVLLAFPIRHAYADRLEIADTTTGGLTIGELQDCYPELVSYEVHTGDAYTVEGSASGFLHRVVVDPGAADPETGACVVDGAADPRAWSRARHPELFDNGIISFRLLRGAADLPGPGDSASFTLAVGQVPFKFQIDVGVLPNGLLYSPADDMLYTVDISRRGLFQIPLTPYDEREVRAFE